MTSLQTLTRRAFKHLQDEPSNTYKTSLQTLTRPAFKHLLDEPSNTY